MRIEHFFLAITLAMCFSCKEKTITVDKIEAAQININDSITGTKAIEDFITPYREHLNKVLDSPLAYTPKALPIIYKDALNSAIGNLMADAIFEQTNPVFKKRTGKAAHFVLLNRGGIRAPIPKGTITARTVYKLMPFENNIVVVELSYEKMEELLRFLAKEKKTHPVSSGINITLNNNYEIKEVTINKKPLEKNKTYYVITSDYLFRGGDEMYFFADPVSVTATDYKVRNALLDYFKKTDTVIAVTDNRFIKTD